MFDHAETLSYYWSTYIRIGTSRRLSATHYLAVLDGRNRAIVIAESLARVIVAV